MKRRLWVLILLGLAAALAALAACGPEPTVQPTITASPSPTSPSDEETESPTGTDEPERTASPPASAAPSPTVAPLSVRIAPLITPTQPWPDVIYVPVPATQASPASGEGPDVLSLTITPDPAFIDDVVTITWSVRGERLDIYTDYASYYDMPLEGSLEARIDGGYEYLYYRPTYSVTLWVTQGNETLYHSAAVNVNCPFTWFMSPSPDLCPLMAAEVKSAAAQPFERGIMLWDETYRTIWVFLYDGALPGYLYLYDAWAEGQPDNDPSLTPPDGLLQPQRGFGKVWRETSGLRDRIGWATAPEYAYTMMYQCTYDSTSCYLLGPSSEVYQIDLTQSPGSWQYYPLP